MTGRGIGEPALVESGHRRRPRHRLQMTDRTSPSEQSIVAEQPSDGVAPGVRRIVSESIPTRDRSLPVLLCRLGGEIGAEATDERPCQPVDRIVEPLANAVASLEGYVRLRQDLLWTDRYDRPADRDAAILAGDSLHATAYAELADVPTTDRRAVALYRTLARGSTTLAIALRSPASPRPASEKADDRPDAILAGTAGSLGATAVGATDDVGAALERYGRSLLTALAALPSERDATRERVARRLADPLAFDSSTDSGGSRASDDRAERTATPTLESHLRRARGAVETLEAATGESADGRTALARLERATRIPFQDVLESND